MAITSLHSHGNIVVQAAYEASTGDMLVNVVGRRNPLRIPGHKFYAGCRTADLIQDALAAAAASVLLPDNRHDRGWPKVAA